MAGLNDLAVFSTQVATAVTEIIQQEVDLFNAATKGCMVLRAGSNAGDFKDVSYYALMAGITRRRNPYGSAPIDTKMLQQIVDTSVKVAAGTPEIQMDKAWWAWMGRDPAEAGSIVGQQLTVAMLQDMVNTAIGCAAAAMQQNSPIVYDHTTDPAITGGNAVKTMDAGALNTARSLFGDKGQRIAIWLMHSKCAYDFWGRSISGTNGNQYLFKYGDIAVMADPFGGVFIITDSPELVIPGTPNKYITLGLVPNAMIVERNNDFDDLMDMRTGNENIRRTYQAEWSYNVGMLGYGWNKQSGGKAPTDAALFSSSSWDLLATDNKNTAGTVLLTY